MIIRLPHNDIVNKNKVYKHIFNDGIIVGRDKDFNRGKQNKQQQQQKKVPKLGYMPNVSTHAQTHTHTYTLNYKILLTL